MKRKTIYGLSTIILLGGLYVLFKLCFGLFTPYNYFTARNDIKNRHVQIIAVGLPEMSLGRQELARKYGFEYNYVGGNATTELLNGTRYYNHVVEEYLILKHGKDFWSKFNIRLDSIEVANSTQVIIDKIIDLVAGQEIVKHQARLIDRLSKSQGHISIIPILDDTIKNTYLVKVGEDNGAALAMCLNFLVNENAMKIINANGRLEGQWSTCRFQ